MNLVEVVILVGAQCLSPMDSGPGLTEVGKVPCAVLIRQDPATSEIDIVPQSAATDPAVIAMLVKPRGAAPVIKADRLPTAAAPDGGITGSITRAPRIVPASAEVDPEELVPQPKPVAKKTRAARLPAQCVAAARRNACGASRAVWYTNKDGRRKYRCVKSG
jgi:hypothetical protein